MATSLIVRVVDAAGLTPATPVPLTIRVHYGGDPPTQWLETKNSGTTPVTVPLAILIDWVWLIADHPDYPSVSVTVTVDAAGKLSWDHRGCHLTGTGTAAPTMTIVLNRVQQAPLATMPFGGAAKGDQPGVFYEGSTTRAYALMSKGLTPVPALRLADEKTPSGSPVPTVLDNPDGTDWDRFLTKTVTGPTLSGNGGFLLLEYGSVTRLNEPRFLVGVWAPRLPGGRLPTDGLDAIVLFSPSTATTDYPPSTYPFRQGYPYGVVSGTVKQPYVWLPLRYLFTEAGLVHYLHAAGKPCLFVMPIFPNVPPNAAGMWQPFNSSGAIHRLLLEVLQFLHAFGYGDARRDFRDWQGATASVDGVPSIQPALLPYVLDEPTPALRHVTLAGFSSASNGLVPALSSQTPTDTQRYPLAMWSADPTAFADRWRELWCLDLDVSTTRTGFAAGFMDKRFVDWQGAGRDRRLRVYQSGYTLGSARIATVYPSLVGRPSVEKAVTSSAGVTPARSASDRRDSAAHWSLLATTLTYTQVASAVPGMPRFPATTDPDGAVHTFMAGLGFGHAATLRLS